MRIALILVIVILVSVASAYGASTFGYDTGRYGFTPQPRLIAPTAETIDLTGKEELEFKWSPHEGRRYMREYYDFRLYKGYEMLEGTLLIKERVDPGAHRFSLKTDMFEDGQVYTWSLRQVYNGIQKSLRSTASFTVINSARSGELKN